MSWIKGGNLCEKVLRGPAVYACGPEGLSHLANGIAHEWIVVEDQQPDFGSNASIIHFWALNSHGQLASTLIDMGPYFEVRLGNVKG
ncbi:hypothetical protein [Devosia salina]|uniref:Uncharacterized protein n=1 Tax=Devosia salina TaxID=2860336 RepID=A0ABX8WN04_9HYPH|nr:hypothetical protein [Devosia salina]QYO79209.1 hypothetical protein K1X15_11125 [Devosia salina]